MIIVIVRVTLIPVLVQISILIVTIERIVIVNQSNQCTDVGRYSARDSAQKLGMLEPKLIGPWEDVSQTPCQSIQALCALQSVTM